MTLYMSWTQTQGKWVSNTAPYLCRTCHKDGTITENRADLRGAVHILSISVPFEHCAARGPFRGS